MWHKFRESSNVDYRNKSTQNSNGTKVQIHFARNEDKCEFMAFLQRANGSFACN